MLETATRPIARKGAILGGSTPNLQNECARNRLVVTPRKTVMSSDKIFKFYECCTLANPEDFSPEECAAFKAGVDHAKANGRILDNPHIKDSRLAEAIAWDAGWGVVKHMEKQLTPR